MSSTAPVKWRATTPITSRAGTATACRSSGRSRRSTAKPVATRMRCRSCNSAPSAAHYAAHWMDVQQQEFRRLGVEGDWAGRYATMDFASEAAIAGEIGKFLLNGALYRGLRPVLWSAGREDRAGRGGGRVPRPHQHDDLGALSGCPRRRFPRCPVRRVVIWTTTPWTMPGNRAIAAGAEFDYALRPCRRRRGRVARAQRASGCWSRWRCCRSSWRMPASPRIMSCMCSKARSWPARSARIRCAGAATSRTRRCCSPIS